MAESRPFTVALTGAAGCLGQHLLRQAPAGWRVVAFWRKTPVAWPTARQVDLADAAATRAAFAELRPDLVLHTAAGMTDFARDLVGAGANVAAAAAAVGARLITCSTDCVFDGEHAPYAETAAPSPIFPYGVAKADLERLVAAAVPDATIARLPLIVSLDPPSRSNAWVDDKLRAGQPVTLFVDELRCPAAAADLAAQLWEIAALPRAAAAGVWHLAGPEALSRYSIGLLLARAHGADPALLRPALNRELKDRRPRDLRMSTARADAALRARVRPLAEALCGPPPRTA